VVLILAGGGCTYLHQAAQQGRYAREQAPQQRVMKHRLAREKYFVYGVIHEGAALPRNSLAVVALSNPPTRQRRPTGAS